ncbi:MAG TPA: hypothetical protein VFA12_11725 [Stellaceae bacterium]|nr:hypothetical protein [Stellaceae bacterium]
MPRENILQLLPDAVVPTVHQLRIEKRGGGEGIRLWVDDLSGLVEIGAVELHPWGATVDDIEHPDLLVFDLDPGEGIAWDFVVETALCAARDARRRRPRLLAEDDRRQRPARDGACCTVDGMG